MSRLNVFRCVFAISALGLCLSLFFFIKTISTPFFYNRPYENKSNIYYPYSFIMHDGGISEFKNIDGENVRYYLGYVDDGVLYGTTSSVDRMQKEAILKNAFILSFEIDGGHIDYVCYEARREYFIELFLIITFVCGSIGFGRRIFLIISNQGNQEPPQQDNN